MLKIHINLLPVFKISMYGSARTSLRPNFNAALNAGPSHGSATREFPQHWLKPCLKARRF